MVALRPGQTEDAFLEDAVTAIPERQAETQPLVDVAETRQAVFAPAIRS